MTPKTTFSQHSPDIALAIPTNQPHRNTPSLCSIKPNDVHVLSRTEPTAHNPQNVVASQIFQLEAAFSSPPAPLV